MEGQRRLHGHRSGLTARTFPNQGLARRSYSAELFPDLRKGSQTSPLRKTENREDPTVRTRHSGRKAEQPEPARDGSLQLDRRGLSRGAVVVEPAVRSGAVNTGNSTHVTTDGLRQAYRRAHPRA